MSGRSRVGNLENLEDSLPSWISEHLGEASSYMTNEMNRLPSTSRENLPEASPLGNDSSNHGGDPGLVTHSPLDDLFSTMTQGDLDHLRKTYSFPMGVQARIVAEGEIILSTCPDEVTFYEAIFPIGHRCFYTLFKNPKPDLGWLYFKVRPGKNVLKESPSNVKGWKNRFFFVSRDDWEILSNTTSDEVPRVPRNKFPLLIDTEEVRMRKVLRNIGPGGYFNVLDVLDSRTFHRFFAPSHGKASFNGRDKDTSGDGTVAALGDEGESLRLRDESPQIESPRDESVEYLRIIKKEWRRILPPLPDLTMLRLLGGKVPDPLEIMSSDNKRNGVNNVTATNNAVSTLGTSNVMPRPTSVTAGHREKPDKFNGLNFKRWQQKMLFYLTTLNLATNLCEDIPGSSKNETNSLTVTTMEA
ncbi:hypothetical protein Acr_00g0031980 [Actinidia rufa]|uniref:Uncharacterized protein n=1 Tax=Actinidia rufa TaxID=165716 RepID=A0A7J0DFQ6_9ERIC|nr:hypothetical protein Acr_00g0031980 [Actinidia rufa]